MLPVSQSVCFTLSSHAKKGLCSQKLCSIFEIRKQVITNKTFENKVPPAYILFLLLLLPTFKSISEAVPSKLRAKLPSLTSTRWLLPPLHLCHHSPPAPPGPLAPPLAGGPGGSRGRWAEACRPPWGLRPLSPLWGSIRVVAWQPSPAIQRGF